MPSQLSLGFTNTLYFGDNLEVMRRYLDNESVDLIYLDPPFKPAINFNILFQHKDGRRPAAQIKAFNDSWTWTMESARVYQEVVESGGQVSKAIRALRELLGTSDLLAYLTMMAPRLVELRRILRSTGTLYLHCDLAASHYLKVLLDAIFGPEQLRNEIVWNRTFAKSLMSTRLPWNHDVLLVYGKTSETRWNKSEAFLPYSEDALDSKTAGKYRFRDDDGRLYRLDNLISPNPNRPNLTYEFLGMTKVWRWTRERMEKAYADGIVVQPSPGSVPTLKRYLDEQRGRPLSDVWTDIPPLNSQAAERLGYPTQKPLALVERIIRLSSNVGDIVLDPFCGCGTTVDAAQRLNRRWIGIDITRDAIEVIVDRLRSIYGQLDYALVGEPSSIDEAHALAELDKHEFEGWVCRRIGAAGAHRKGADRGIDGEFVGVFDNGESWRGIVSVKGGAVGVSQVRDLWGVVQREKAEFGIYVSLKPLTPAMKREGADAGFTSQGVPRLQVVTVEQILDRGYSAIQLPEGHKAEEKKRKLRAV